VLPPNRVQQKNCTEEENPAKTKVQGLYRLKPEAQPPFA
jgi:hypothetical protein